MAGSILYRGNGKYKLSYMKNTQRYNTTVTAVDMAEAEELLKKFINSVNKLSNIDIRKCTLSEFVDLYFEYYAYEMLAQECYYNYRKTLDNWVLPKIGDALLIECTSDFFIKYLEWLSKQISPKTHKLLSVGSKEKIFGVISSVFSCAVMWKLFAINPLYAARPDEFKRKAKNKLATVQSRCLTLEESRKLIKALHTVDLKYQIIVHLAIIGGLRRSEILGIKWQNIDLKNHTLDIKQSSQYVPKKGYVVGEVKNETSERTIALPKSTVLMLLDYKMNTTGYDNDFVFINDKGRRKGLRLNPVSVTAWFKRFRESIDLPPEVPLHGLRHTNATILITKGINVKNVSSRLGHSNIGTTLNVYSHALTSVDKVAGNTLDKILFKRKHAFRIQKKKKEDVLV